MLKELNDFVFPRGDLNPLIWQGFLVIFSLLFLYAVVEIYELNQKVIEFKGGVSTVLAGRDAIRFPPYTIINKGQITSVFFSKKGEIISWYVPLQAYLDYTALPKEYKTLAISNTSFGEVLVPDYRPFVRAELFSPVIHHLTDGRTDREFVEEVFNMRRQLTTYGKLYALDNVTQWPIETLTSTVGTCRDFTVLMASLLKAGNIYADYGMNFSIFYIDSNNPDKPKIPNHVLLYITYADGSRQCLDSTAVSEMCPWPKVVGWAFDI